MRLTGAQAGIDVVRISSKCRLRHRIRDHSVQALDERRDIRREGRGLVGGEAVVLEGEEGVAVDERGGVGGNGGDGRAGTAVEVDDGEPGLCRVSMSRHG